MRGQDGEAGLRLRQGERRHPVPSGSLPGRQVFGRSVLSLTDYYGLGVQGITLVVQIPPYEKIKLFFWDYFGWRLGFAGMMDVWNRRFDFVVLIISCFGVVLKKCYFLVVVIVCLWKLYFM